MQLQRIECSIYGHNVWSLCRCLINRVPHIDIYKDSITIMGIMYWWEVKLKTALFSPCTGLLIVTVHVWRTHRLHVDSIHALCTLWNCFSFFTNRICIEHTKTYLTWYKIYFIYFPYYLNSFYQKFYVIVTYKSMVYCTTIICSTFVKLVFL